MGWDSHRCRWDTKLTVVQGEDIHAQLQALDHSSLPSVLGMFLCLFSSFDSKLPFPIMKSFFSPLLKKKKRKRKAAVRIMSYYLKCLFCSMYT